MARKAKTPPPPRRPVQAPKVRTAPRDPAERRRLLFLVLFAASGIAALGAVLAVLAFTGGDNSGSTADGGVRAALERAGCTFETAEDLGRRHVDSLEAEVDFNTTPPTSGPHYFRWAVWGIYEEPLNELLLVHNLEHGGVVVQYGPQVPRETVAETAAFYNEDQVGILVAPHPELGNQIALTAWTRIAKCPGFDREAFAAFRDAFRFKGPEEVPIETMQPGA